MQLNAGPPVQSQLLHRLAGELEAAHLVYHQVFLLDHLSGLTEGGFHDRFSRNPSVADVYDPVHEPGYPWIVGDRNDGDLFRLAQGA